MSKVVRVEERDGETVMTVAVEMDLPGSVFSRTQSMRVVLAETDA
jgi:hypothetical protein